MEKNKKKTDSVSNETAGRGNRAANAHHQATTARAPSRRVALLHGPICLVSINLDSKVSTRA